MKILITGGRGFIARYLARMMVEKGWHVAAPGREELDVRNRYHFERFNNIDYDAVIHLASLLMIDGYDSDQYFLTNATGTFNVLEFCRQNKIPKIVYAMTHSDVNKCGNYLIDEYTEQHFGTNSFEHNAIPFISSKIAAADMVAAYHREKVLQGIILRLANIRGYGSRDERYGCVFHQFIQKAIKGEDIEIWGDPPKTVRDLIYIKDICNAFIAAVESDTAYGYYNIGSGKGMTIVDEAKAVIDVFSTFRESKSKLVYKPEIEEVRKISCVFDIDRAKKDLGWEPKYSQIEGLEDYKREMGEDDDK